MKRSSLPSGLIALAIVFSISTQAHAIMMRGDVPSSAYEAYAQESQFASSGWMGGVHDDGLTYPLGNGTYLGDGWVLTAAHVVEDIVNAPGFVEIQFGVGPDFYNDWGEYAVADAWTINPNWDRSAGWGQTTDLALVHLSTTLDVEAAMLYEGVVEAGDEISGIGHGVPGTNSIGWLDYDGVERAGTNVINGYGGDGLGYLTYSSQFMFAEFDEGAGETDLEFMAAPYDSGGGVYIFDDLFNDWYLAGVTSFITATGIPGLFDNRHTGIQSFTVENRAWIAETTAVPEPGTLILFATGAIGLLPLRRRRKA